LLRIGCSQKEYIGLYYFSRRQLGKSIRGQGIRHIHGQPEATAGVVDVG
jgi:hypothetical protein